MARLIVTTNPSAGASMVMISVDGTPVDGIDPDGPSSASVDVAGSCGDGSEHILNYSFEGEAGETLGVSVTCAGNEVCAFTETVSVLGGRNCAGEVEFTL